MRGIATSRTARNLVALTPSGSSPQHSSGSVPAHVSPERLSALCSSSEQVSLVRLFNTLPIPEQFKCLGTCVNRIG